MKKILLIITFIILCSISYSQFPIEFSTQFRGSDINGLVGIELQLKNIGISQGWRPMIRNINSYTTTITKYSSNPFIEAYPYITLGYASNGYPYTNTLFLTGSYSADDVEFYPAVFFLVGLKSITYDVTDRLNGKVGLGLTLSEMGHFFSFELSINYILLKRKKI